MIIFLGRHNGVTGLCYRAMGVFVQLDRRVSGRPGGQLFCSSDSRTDCHLDIPAVHLLARCTLWPEAEHFGHWHVAVRRDIPLPLSGIQLSDRAGSTTVYYFHTALCHSD
jgi:hypothetical protein